MFYYKNLKINKAHCSALLTATQLFSFKAILPVIMKNSGNLNVFLTRRTI